MNLIMENWRRNTCEFDPIYVENVLGIKIPLVEGRYRISESLRKEILLQENFIKNFFKGAKEKVFDKLGAFGSIMKTLAQVITDPSKIKTYVTSIMRMKINPYLNALKKIKQKLVSLNMPTFASGIDKIFQDMQKIKSEGKPVRKALSFTSMVLLLEWCSGLISDQVDEVKKGLLGLPQIIENLDKEALNIIQNILIKLLPKQMAKVFAAIGAASAAFPAWALVIYKLVQGATWVGEVLKDTLKSYRTRVDRQDRKKAAQAAGTQAVGPDGQINIAEREINNENNNTTNKRNNK